MRNQSTKQKSRTYFTSLLFLVNQRYTKKKKNPSKNQEKERNYGPY